MLPFKNRGAVVANKGIEISTIALLLKKPGSIFPKTRLSLTCPPLPVAGDAISNPE